MSVLVRMADGLAALLGLCSAGFEAASRGITRVRNRWVARLNEKGRA